MSVSKLHLEKLSRWDVAPDVSQAHCQILVMCSATATVHFTPQRNYVLARPHLCGPLCEGDGTVTQVGVSMFCCTRG